MTPMEQCFSICCALARSGHAAAIEIGQTEIHRMLNSIDDNAYARARALENLAFDLAVAVEANDVATALDREIVALLRGLGAAAI
ncbi:hypothetical protein JOD31_001040 [Methylopila capsulata]|uniref:Uncharacterized protein n=1 Tax=Methylopila capsulata TaxID=61654 RepID=A0A9W6IV09_9HYPH|nr:hypothetical protein [Methylopila capsulata]MBM7850828.1 hypothetical protein [Methylopila capsulata]GLK56122.1 hypothetical protein GCM10008170_21410 [Methylopila capsulata]